MLGSKESTMDYEAKLKAVEEKLAQVLDPELDESLIELRFIEAIKIEPDGRVRVEMRLPTYWCAANFAFMMADDIRARVGELEWVKSVAVELKDHFYSDRINQGVSEGKSFVETFPDEATEELEALRALFRAKGFQRRQHKLLRYLLERGYAERELSLMTVGQLRALTLVDDEGERLRARYLEARCGLKDGAPDDSFAFVELDCRPIGPQRFGEYLKRVRRVWLNTEMNGIFCRSLLEARYGEKIQ